MHPAEIRFHSAGLQSIPYIRLIMIESDSSFYGVQHIVSIIIEEGEMLHCSCGSDRGVKEIQVACEQRSHPTYELGELVFRAEIKQLTDKKMTVFHPTTGEEYVFVRIDF